MKQMNPTLIVLTALAVTTTRFDMATAASLFDLTGVPTTTTKPPIAASNSCTSPTDIIMCSPIYSGMVVQPPCCFIGNSSTTNPSAAVTTKTNPPATSTPSAASVDSQSTGSFANLFATSNSCTSQNDKMLCSPMYAGMVVQPACCFIGNSSTTNPSAAVTTKTNPPATSTPSAASVNSQSTQPTANIFGGLLIGSGTTSKSYCTSPTEIMMCNTTTFLARPACCSFGISSTTKSSAITTKTNPPATSTPPASVNSQSTVKSGTNIFGIAITNTATPSSSTQKNPPATSTPAPASTPSTPSASTASSLPATANSCTSQTDIMMCNPIFAGMVTGVTKPACCSTGPSTSPSTTVAAKTQSTTSKLSGGLFGLNGLPTGSVPPSALSSKSVPTSTTLDSKGMNVNGAQLQNLYNLFGILNKSSSTTVKKI